MRLTTQALAAMIDHTLLKPFVTKRDIAGLCREAKEHGFANVCVNPVYVPLAAELLDGTGVGVCTVIGFPLGASSLETKVAETLQAVRQGAREVDMVINIGALKSADTSSVRSEIGAVVEAAGGLVTKVIIETCYLTDEEKVEACLLAKEAGAKFVKTSTGFGTGGATVRDVELMRRTVGEAMGVKASGGIRTCAEALAMIQAGANRLGTSAGVAILQEFTLNSSCLFDGNSLE